MKIVELDDKKRTDAEKVAFDFRTRHISVANISEDILVQIHGWLLTRRQACRRDWRKASCRQACNQQNATVASSLPCRHIFHEHTRSS